MVQLLTSLVKLYGGTEDRIDRAMKRYLTGGSPRFISLSL